MISVLIVDDHELVRSGIEALLNAAEGISVVGIANSGEEALSVVCEKPVDIVLMDVSMPGIGGLEACRRMLNMNPEVKIIALSVRHDSPIPQQLFNLGVLGFVSKGSPVDEMVNAIRQVMLGKRYVCKKVAYNFQLTDQPKDRDLLFEKLSRRESQVVALILQGKTIKEMAEILGVKDKTVNTFRYRIYFKLKIKNDVELTHLALKHGHIDTG